MPDYRRAVEALKIVDSTQPLGTELFNALARITVSVAVEAVCLRYNSEKKKVEVYLIQRSPNDTAYPHEWHCPGSVMRPGESFKDVLGRLAEGEFGANLVSPRFVANINPSASEPEARGHFLSIVYLCTLEEKKALRGKWFSTDQLPEQTVEHHRTRIIPCALGAFVADNSFTRR
ncbi:MAG: NUDIX domain-containing protein [Candidatus Staskawiczbacteria bacterium]|jgi:ADP-ribose pyrophosphatase YjhB (NUDIX family)